MPDFQPTRRKRVISAQGVALANPAAFSAPYRAITQAGQAVAQVGQQWAEVMRQRQQVDDYKAESESNRLFDESLSGLRTDMVEEGDRAKFPKLWDKRKRLAEKSMKLEGLSRDARVRIEERWKDVQSKAKIVIEKESTVRAVQEARASTDEEVQLHLENGDLILAQERVRAAGAANVYSAEESQKRLRGLEREYDQTQARKLVQADPYEALDSLKETTESGRYRNFKNLDDRERQSLVTHARVERNRQQTDLYNQVIHATQVEDLDAEERASMWEYVQLQHGKQRISDSQATALHNALVPKNNLPNWKLVQPLHASVMAVDTTGGQYTNSVVSLRKRIATENLPASERGKLLQLLEERFAPDSAPNKLEYKAAMDDIGRQLQSGALGFDMGEDGLSKQPNEEAHQRAHQLRREVDRMFRADPNLSYEKVKERLSSVHSQQMSLQAGDIFTPRTGRYSGGGDNPVDLDALKAKLKELKR